VLPYPAIVKEILHMGEMVAIFAESYIWQTPYSVGFVVSFNMPSWKIAVMKLGVGQIYYKPLDIKIVNVKQWRQGHPIRVRPIFILECQFVSPPVIGGTHVLHHGAKEK
jgi:hypothetical protein